MSIYAAKLTILPSQCRACIPGQLPRGSAGAIPTLHRVPASGLLKVLWSCTSASSRESTWNTRARCSHGLHSAATALLFHRPHAASLCIFAQSQAQCLTRLYLFGVVLSAVTSDKKWTYLREWSLKPIGYTWSYLACRIGHLAPVWQPLVPGKL
jgi:hypothetical protein